MKKIVPLLLFCLPLAASPAAARKAPAVILSAPNPYFSPNKDGVRDQVAFQVETRKIDKVWTWELVVKDAMSSVRRIIREAEKPLSGLSWNGTDDFGAPLPEGSYEASLTVWNEDEEPFYSPPVRVSLDLTPPTLSLTARPQSGGKVPFNFSAVDLSGIARWEFQLLDENKLIIHSFVSSGPVPASWDLPEDKMQAVSDKFVAVLSVNDRAGNTGTSAPVLLGNGAAPARPAEIDPAIKYLQSTTLLSVADLFGGEAGSGSQLLPQASALLDPVARTLQEAAGSRATVLGHVDAQASPKEAKALSSYFAWRVFSYLVRERGVDKGAMTVKGLGADVPIAENRTALGRSRNRRIEIQVFVPAR